MKIFERIKRSISWAVVFFFTATSLQIAPRAGYAETNGSGPSQEDGQTLTANPSRLAPLFNIPPEIGSVERVFRGGTSEPQVYYIQDAHTSLEAQENIAKIIAGLAADKKIQSVFVEGAEGETPLDHLFAPLDSDTRRKVSYFFMDYLRLNGARFAFINRDRSHDFKLIGLENVRDYQDDLAAYERGAQHREEIASDLAKISKELNALADRLYPKEIKEWRKLKERFKAKQLSLADYIFRIFKLEGRSALVTEDYPHLSLITTYLAKDDLTKSEQDELNQKFNQIDPKVFFNELQRFEQEFSKRYLTDPVAQQTFEYQGKMDLLNELNQLQLAPEEFQKLASSIQQTAYGKTDVPNSALTAEIAHFLASNLHKSLVLSSRWEELIQEQVHFYELAEKRDKDFQEHLRTANYDRPVVVVTGGFHQSGVTKFLEDQKISFAVLSPKITREDALHSKRYDFLMSGGTYPFERSLGPAVHAAIPEQLEVIAQSKDLTPLLEAAGQSLDPEGRVDAKKLEVLLKTRRVIQIVEHTKSLPVPAAGRSLGQLEVTWHTNPWLDPERFVSWLASQDEFNLVFVENLIGGQLKMISTENQSNQEKETFKTFCEKLGIESNPEWDRDTEDLDAKARKRILDEITVWDQKTGTISRQIRKGVLGLRYDNFETAFSKRRTLTNDEKSELRKIQDRFYEKYADHVLIGKGLLRLMENLAAATVYGTVEFSTLASDIELFSFEKVKALDPNREKMLEAFRMGLEKSKLDESNINRLKKVGGEPDKIRQAFVYKVGIMRNHILDSLMDEVQKKFGDIVLKQAHKESLAVEEVKRLREASPTVQRAIERAVNLEQEKQRRSTLELHEPLIQKLLTVWNQEFPLLPYKAWLIDSYKQILTSQKTEGAGKGFIKKITQMLPRRIAQGMGVDASRTPVYIPVDRLDKLTQAILEARDKNNEMTITFAGMIDQGDRELFDEIFQSVEARARVKNRAAREAGGAVGASLGTKVKETRSRIVTLLPLMGGLAVGSVALLDLTARKPEAPSTTPSSIGKSLGQMAFTWHTDPWKDPERFVGWLAAQDELDLNFVQNLISGQLKMASTQISSEEREAFRIFCEKLGVKSNPEWDKDSAGMDDQTRQRILGEIEVWDQEMGAISRHIREGVLGGLYEQFEGVFSGKRELTEDEKRDLEKVQQQFYEKYWNQLLTGQNLSYVMELTRLTENLSKATVYGTVEYPSLLTDIELFGSEKARTLDLHQEKTVEAFRQNLEKSNLNTDEIDLLRRLSKGPDKVRQALVYKIGERRNRILDGLSDEVQTNYKDIIAKQARGEALDVEEVKRRRNVSPTVDSVIKRAVTLEQDKIKQASLQEYGSLIQRLFDVWGGIFPLLPYQVWVKDNYQQILGSQTTGVVEQPGNIKKIAQTTTSDANKTLVLMPLDRLDQLTQDTLKERDKENSLTRALAALIDEGNKELFDRIFETVETRMTARMRALRDSSGASGASLGTTHATVLPVWFERINGDQLADLEVLGLSEEMIRRTEDPEERLSKIKKAFRRLIAAYHPDRHPNEKEVFNKITQRIIAAYERLSDPDWYRQPLVAGLKSNSTASPGNRYQRNSHQTDSKWESIWKEVALTDRIIKFHLSGKQMQGRDYAADFSYYLKNLLLVTFTQIAVIILGQNILDYETASPLLLATMAPLSYLITIIYQPFLHQYMHRAASDVSGNKVDHDSRIEKYMARQFNGRSYRELVLMGLTNSFGFLATAGILVKLVASMTNTIFYPVLSSATLLIGTISVKKSDKKTGELQSSPTNIFTIIRIGGFINKIKALYKLDGISGEQILSLKLETFLRWNGPLFIMAGKPERMYFAIPVEKNMVIKRHSAELRVNVEIDNGEHVYPVLGYPIKIIGQLVKTREKNSNTFFTYGKNSYALYRVDLNDPDNQELLLILKKDGKFATGYSMGRTFPLENYDQAKQLAGVLFDLYSLNRTPREYPLKPLLDQVKVSQDQNTGVYQIRIKFPDEKLTGFKVGPDSAKFFDPTLKEVFPSLEMEKGKVVAVRVLYGGVEYRLFRTPKGYRLDPVDSALIHQKVFWMNRTFSVKEAQVLVAASRMFESQIVGSVETETKQDLFDLKYLPGIDPVVIKDRQLKIQAGGRDAEAALQTLQQLILGQTAIDLKTGKLVKGGETFGVAIQGSSLGRKEVTVPSTGASGSSLGKEDRLRQMQGMRAALLSVRDEAVNLKPHPRDEILLRVTHQALEMDLEGLAGKSADEIKDKVLKAKAFKELALYRAQQEDWPKAFKIAEEIKAFGIDSEYYGTLSEIALYQKGERDVPQSVAEALATIQKIKDPLKRLEALHYLMPSHYLPAFADKKQKLEISAQDIFFDLYKELLDTLEIAKKDAIQNRSFADLRQIAVIELYYHSLPETQKTLQAIQDPYERILALAEAGFEVYEWNPEASRALFKESEAGLPILRKSSPELESLARAKIIKLEADTGYQTRAERLINQITDPNERVSLAVTILISRAPTEGIDRWSIHLVFNELEALPVEEVVIMLAQLGSFSLAKEMAASISDPQKREKGFYVVSKHLIKSGDLKEAEDVMTKVNSSYRHLDLALDLLGARWTILMDGELPSEGKSLGNADARAALAAEIFNGYSQTTKGSSLGAYEDLQRLMKLEDAVRNSFETREPFSLEKFKPQIDELLSGPSLSLSRLYFRLRLRQAEDPTADQVIRFYDHLGEGTPEFQRELFRKELKKLDIYLTQHIARQTESLVQEADEINRDYWRMSIVDELEQGLKELILGQPAESSRAIGRSGVEKYLDWVESAVMGLLGQGLDPSGVMPIAHEVDHINTLLVEDQPVTPQDLRAVFNAVKDFSKTGPEEGTGLGASGASLGEIRPILTDDLLRAFQKLNHDSPLEIVEVSGTSEAPTDDEYFPEYRDIQGKLHEALERIVPKLSSKRDYVAFLIRRDHRNEKNAEKNRAHYRIIIDRAEFLERRINDLWAGSELDRYEFLFEFSVYPSRKLIYWNYLNLGRQFAYDLRGKGLAPLREIARMFEKNYPGYSIAGVPVEIPRGTGDVIPNFMERNFRAEHLAADDPKTRDLAKFLGLRGNEADYLYQGKIPDRQPASVSAESLGSVDEVLEQLPIEKMSGQDFNAFWQVKVQGAWKEFTPGSKAQLIETAISRLASPPQDMNTFASELQREFFKRRIFLMEKTSPKDPDLRYAAFLLNFMINQEAKGSRQLLLPFANIRDRISYYQALIVQNKASLWDSGKSPLLRLENADIKAMSDYLGTVIHDGSKTRAETHLRILKKADLLIDDITAAQSLGSVDEVLEKLPIKDMTWTDFLDYWVVEIAKDKEDFDEGSKAPLIKNAIQGLMSQPKNLRFFLGQLERAFLFERMKVFKRALLEQPNRKETETAFRLLDKLMYEQFQEDPEALVNPDDIIYRLDHYRGLITAYGDKLWNKEGSPLTDPFNDRIRLIDEHLGTLLPASSDKVSRVQEYQGVVIAAETYFKHFAYQGASLGVRAPAISGPQFNVDMDLILKSPDTRMVPVAADDRLAKEALDDWNRVPEKDLNEIFKAAGLRFPEGVRDALLNGFKGLSLKEETAGRFQKLVETGGLLKVDLNPRWLQALTQTNSRYLAAWVTDDGKIAVLARFYDYLAAIQDDRERAETAVAVFSSLLLSQKLRDILKEKHIPLDSALAAKIQQASQSWIPLSQDRIQVFIDQMMWERGEKFEAVIKPRIDRGRQVERLRSILDRLLVLRDKLHTEGRMTSEDATALKSLEAEFIIDPKLSQEIQKDTEGKNSETLERMRQDLIRQYEALEGQIMTKAGKDDRTLQMLNEKANIVLNRLIKTEFYLMQDLFTERKTIRPVLKDTIEHFQSKERELLWARIRSQRDKKIIQIFFKDASDEYLKVKSLRDIVERRRRTGAVERKEARWTAQEHYYLTTIRALLDALMGPNPIVSNPGLWKTRLISYLKMRLIRFGDKPTAQITLDEIALALFDNEAIAQDAFRRVQSWIEAQKAVLPPAEIRSVGQLLQALVPDTKVSEQRLARIRYENLLNFYRSRDHVIETYAREEGLLFGSIGYLEDAESRLKNFRREPISEYQKRMILRDLEEVTGWLKRGKVYEKQSAQRALTTAQRNVKMEQYAVALARIREAHNLLENVLLKRVDRMSWHVSRHRGAILEELNQGLKQVRLGIKDQNRIEFKKALTSLSKFYGKYLEGYTVQENEPGYRRAKVHVTSAINALEEGLKTEALPAESVLRRVLRNLYWLQYDIEHKYETFEEMGTTQEKIEADIQGKIEWDILSRGESLGQDRGGRDPNYKALQAVNYQNLYNTVSFLSADKPGLPSADNRMIFYNDTGGGLPSSYNPLMTVKALRGITNPDKYLMHSIEENAKYISMLQQEVFDIELKAGDIYITRKSAFTSGASLGGRMVFADLQQDFEAWARRLDSQWQGIFTRYPEGTEPLIALADFWNHLSVNSYDALQKTLERDRNYPARITTQVAWGSPNLITLTLTDNGSGITESMLEYVLEQKATDKNRMKGSAILGGKGEALQVVSETLRNEFPGSSVVILTKEDGAAEAFQKAYDPATNTGKVTPLNEAEWDKLGIPHGTQIRISIPAQGISAPPGVMAEGTWIPSRDRILEIADKVSGGVRLGTFALYKEFRRSAGELPEDLLRLSGEDFTADIAVLNHIVKSDPRLSQHPDLNMDLTFGGATASSLGRELVTLDTKLEPLRTYVWTEAYGTGLVTTGDLTSSGGITVRFYDRVKRSYEKDFKQDSVARRQLYLATEEEIARYRKFSLSKGASLGALIPLPPGRDLIAVADPNEEAFAKPTAGKSLGGSQLEQAQVTIRQAAGIIHMDEALVEKIIQPERVIEVEIPVLMENGETKIFHGFRSQHNSARGPYKGGFRMGTLHDVDGTRDEAIALSTWMSIKTAVAGLPLGGGKGDIIVDRKALSRLELARLTRGYIREIAKKAGIKAIGPFTDVPAPDMNTDAEIMGWFLDEYLKILVENQGIYDLRLQSLLETFIKSQKEWNETETPLLKEYIRIVQDEKVGGFTFDTIELGTITGKPAGPGPSSIENPFFPLDPKNPYLGGSQGRTKATGQGGFFALSRIMEKNGESVEGKSVAIQGYGNVGSYAARIMQDAKMKITALQAAYRSVDPAGKASFKSFTITNENGIDIAALDKWADDEAKRLGTRDFSFEAFPGAKAIPNDEFWKLNVDVLVPAALNGQITEKNAGGIQARYILELANGPTTPEADEILKQNRKIVIPDVLANSGGVIVSYLEMIQNETHDRWVESVVDRILFERMAAATDDLIDVRNAYNVTLREAAYIVALMKIANAEVARDLELKARYASGEIAPYENKGVNLSPETLDELNQAVENGTIKDFAQETSYQFDRTIQKVVSEIQLRFGKGNARNKVILVTGPAAVGKAGVARKFMEELKRRDPRVKVRFIDKDLISDTDVKDLLSNRRTNIQLPRHEFHGAKIPTDVTVEPGEILVIEGNESFQLADLKNGDDKPYFGPNDVYKVFVNVSPSFRLKRGMPLTSFHLRFLRDILDRKNRRGESMTGKDVLAILKGWHGLKEKQNRRIYNQWIQADSTVNTFSPEEISVMRSQMIPLLKEAILESKREVKEGKDPYAQVWLNTLNSYRAMLNSFKPLDISAIPADSPIRQWLVSDETKGQSLGVDQEMVKLALKGLKETPVSLVMSYPEYLKLDQKVKSELEKDLLEERVKVLFTDLPRGAVLPATFRQKSKLIQAVEEPLTAALLTTVQGFLGEGKLIHISEELASPEAVSGALNETQKTRLVFIQPKKEEGLVSAALLFVSGSSRYQDAFRKDVSGFWVPTELGRLMASFAQEFLSSQILAEAA